MTWQLNVDIINADACISTGTADSHVAFDTGTAKCNDVNPFGGCGCQTLVPKRSIYLTNSECSTTVPQCHEFKCISNKCRYGRRHTMECSSNRDCNADPTDAVKSKTCVGGADNGQKCASVSDCGKSLAHTSCTASSSLSVEDIFINDLSVKQFDITYSYGKCFNAVTGGATNGQTCIYNGNNCGGSYPYCQLLEIDSSVGNGTTSGALSDFPIATLKPEKAMCRGVGANANSFVSCHRAGDGQWNTAHPQNQSASVVCANPNECATLDNMVSHTVCR